MSGNPVKFITKEKLIRDFQKSETFLSFINKTILSQPEIKKNNFLIFSYLVILCHPNIFKISKNNKYTDYV